MEKNDSWQCINKSESMTLGSLARPNPTTDINEKIKNQLNHEPEKNLRKFLFGDRHSLLENLKNVSEKHNLKKRPVALVDGSTNSDDDDADRNLNKKQPVWQDSDDELVEENAFYFKNRNYNRKQRNPLNEHTRSFKDQLKLNFERSIGKTPTWATIDPKSKINTSSDSDASDNEIVQTIGHKLNAGTIQDAKLRPNILQYKRLKDLNRATYSEGPGISAIEFHPKSTCAMVSGLCGITTVYSIDGERNDKLHSIQFKNFPIKCCRIHPDGEEAIIGSNKNYYYAYNLMTGETDRLFLPKQITNMKRFILSECGNFIGIIGRFGEIHLCHYQTKELICTFKQEYEATALHFTNDSKQLIAHSNDAEITVFDLTAQRICHRFIDDGCVNGSTVTISPSNHYLAAGSEQGVVNIYDYATAVTQKYPKPLKTIYNLTTAITNTKFNVTGELLAICSRELVDACKLVHVQTGTVYKNFPQSFTGKKLGKINVISFSPQSGYFAVGNTAKEVPLFRLRHYKNY